MYIHEHYRPRAICFCVVVFVFGNQPRLCKINAEEECKTDGTQEPALNEEQLNFSDTLFTQNEVLFVLCTAPSPVIVSVSLPTK
jgi:hypothetical protein